MPTLALIHTVHSIIPEIEDICRRVLPGAHTVHLLDEAILRDLIARGSMDADIVRRVSGLVIRAEQGGADAALITCSSIGGCAETTERLVSIPVRRIDGPMAAKAVRRGGTVAVAATLQTTLGPTVSLLRHEARRLKKRVRIEAVLFDRAFQAITSGDAELHDEILRKGLADLAEKARTIVLAQASMARVLGSLKIPEGTKVLTSPDSGIRQMRRVLEA